MRGGIINLTNQLIFIPGNVPSLKNSKVMGRFPSETVKKWLRTFGISKFDSRKNRRKVEFFKRIPKQYDFEAITAELRTHTDYPLKVGFHFVRSTRREWDFGNACQILLDLFTAFEIIPDDNVSYILPFPLEINGVYYTYDKDNAGVYVQVL